MLRNGIAYELAGRKLTYFDESETLENLFCNRCLVLQSADKCAHALQILECLPELGVQVDVLNPCLIWIYYSLNTYSLEEIEQHLHRQSVTLDQSYAARFRRAWLHFYENTQQHNLQAPKQRLLKNSHEIYVQAYGHHSHGDYDDTPVDLRELK